MLTINKYIRWSQQVGDHVEKSIISKSKLGNHQKDLSVCSKNVLSGKEELFFSTLILICIKLKRGSVLFQCENIILEGLEVFCDAGNITQVSLDA